MRIISYALAAFAAVAFTGIGYADVEAFDLPLALEPTQEEASRFIILDENDDDSTWAWYGSDANGMMRYTYSSFYAADDWFFIPVNLTESDTNLYFSCLCRDQLYFPEKFSVGIGAAPTPSAMTILGERDVTVSEWQPYELIFNNSIVGEAYLGFHAQSVANQYFLDICAIQLYAMTIPLPNVPVITEENVEYLDYSAIVTMPTQDIFGNPLPSGTELTLLCQVTGMEPMTFISQPGGSVEVNFTAEKGKRDVIYTVQMEQNGETLNSAPVRSIVTFLRMPGSFSLPFSMAPTEEDLEECTVLDNNNDTSTWEYSSTKHAFCYMYNRSNEGDDYLILPGINTEGVSAVNFKFNAFVESQAFNESFDVLMGTTPNFNEMEVVLSVPAINVTIKTPYEFEQVIPEGAATVYFAFHAVSQPDKYYLYISDIEITAASTVGVPETLSSDSVKVVKGGLIISGADNSVRIIGIDGRIAAEAANGFIALEKGLYIVEANGRTMKVNIR